MKSFTFLLLLFISSVVNGQTDTVILKNNGIDTILSRNGFITDEGFLGMHYSNNADQAVLIRPGTTNVNYWIKLSYCRLDRYDTLYIYNGETMNEANLLLKVAGGVTVRYAKTTAGAFVLRFKSDKNMVFEGFTVEYSSFVGPPEPNLIAGPPAAMFSVLPKDTAISIKCGITVNGGFINTSFKYAVYLSQNPLWDTADILLLQDSALNVTPDSVLNIGKLFKIPASTDTGSYYLLTYADNVQGLTEPNEADNIYAQPIRVGSGHDVSQLKLSTRLYGGQGLTITGNSFTLKNYGRVAIAFRYKILLSTDTIPDAGDYTLRDAYETIIPGGSSTVSLTAPLNPAITPGSYYVICQTDADSLITEVNEQNNIAYIPMYVAAALPDLTLRFEEMTEIFAVNGIITDSIVNLFKYRYTNIGPVSVTGTRVYYYLSYDSVWSVNDDLVWGENYDINAFSGVFGTDYWDFFNAQISIYGECYLIVVLDSANNIAELSESNNVYKKKIFVWQDYDLLIKGNEPDASMADVVVATTTSSYRPAFTAGNQSAVKTGDFRELVYFSNDSILSTNDQLLNNSTRGPIARCAYALNNGLQVNLPAGLTTGTYYVFIKLEGLNPFGVPDLADVDTTNNTIRQKIIVVNPFIDLQVRNFKGTKPTITIPGDTLLLQCAVVNYGQLLATNITTRFYISIDKQLSSGDSMVNSKLTASLLPNGVDSFNVSIPIPLNILPQKYYLLAKTDADSTIAEQFENNNLKIDSVTIEPAKSDLRIQGSGSSSATTIVIGSSLNLNVVIRNSGRIASAPSVTAFYFSTDSFLSAGDILLDTVETAAVPIINFLSSSKLVGFPLSLTTGAAYLIVKVDNGNTEDEYDETNNTKPYAINLISPSFNYLATSLTSNKISYLQGDSGQATLSARLASNIGYQSTKCALYFSTDNVLSGNDVLLDTFTATISSAATVQVTSNFVLPSAFSGNCFLIAKIDKDDAFAESDENDNIAATAVIRVVVPTYDIDVDNADFTFVNNGCAPSGPRGLKFDLINTTGYNCPSVTCAIYLSTNTSIGGTDILLSTTAALRPGTNSNPNTHVVQVSIPSVPVGNYYVLVKADENNQVAELDETNNVALTAFEVDDCTPQLKTSNFTFNYSTIDLNQPVNFSADVSTTYPASNVQYKVLLSQDLVPGTDDVTLDSGTISAISTSSSQLVSGNSLVPANLITGTYYNVLFYCDANNQYTETNEGDNISSKTVYVNDTQVIIGINNIENPGMKISLYPNPVSDEITIQVGQKLIEANATIYSLTGNALRTTVLESETTVLKVSDLAAGVYFAQVKIGKLLHRFKFVKL